MPDVGFQLASAVKRMRLTLRDHLPTVTLERFSGYGASGFGQTKVYYAGTNYKAYFKREHRKIVNDAGQEIVSKARVIFLESVAVNPDDRITLPDSTTPPIQSVTSPTDADGAAYLTEVWF